jgi:hypothetical protein
MRSDTSGRAGESEPTTAGEWHDLNRRRYIDELRRQAKRAYGQSVLYAGIDDQAAEQAAIKSLSLVTRAFWNAEDSELEAPIHDDMHRYGKHKRQTFGCHLAYANGAYYYGGGQSVWPLRRVSCRNAKLTSPHLIAPVISALSNSDCAQALRHVCRLHRDIPSMFDLR